MSETDPTKPPEEKSSPKRSPKPSPVDRLGARVEGCEAVAEWARQTAIGAAMVALLILLAVCILAWRLRGSLSPLAPASMPAPAGGLA